MKDRNVKKLHLIKVVKSGHNKCPNPLGWSTFFGNSSSVKNDTTLELKCRNIWCLQPKRHKILLTDFWNYEYKKTRPLLRTKPGKIGTGKLDKNAVVRHESHLEVPGNEEQSKSATKWWEDKWGQDLRYEASILTYLKFLYFVVYVLTCDKGKEWVAMPSWNFAWAWRCQGAKEPRNLFLFCSLMIISLAVFPL